MAQQGKKKDKGTRNSDRRNGKAFKKHPKPMGKRVRTEERQYKDYQILVQRDARRLTNQARREEEARLAAELAAQVAADVARRVAEENSRIAAVKLLAESVNQVPVPA